MNLNYYGTRHGPWPARRELIAAAIDAAAPDIVVLQAVRGDPAVEGGLDQAAQLAQRFPAYRHTHFQATHVHDDGSVDGMALLSRFAIARTSHLPLTLRPGLEDANPRVVLQAQLDLPSGPLHVFNAHFSWVYTQGRDNVGEALTYAGSFVGPALLLGDLNTLPEADLMQRFRESGWIDAWAHCNPGQPGYTFESGQLDRRIDYAWARQELQTQIEAVEIVAGEPGPDGVRASDHLGLLLTLRC